MDLGFNLLRSNASPEIINITKLNMIPDIDAYHLLKAAKTKHWKCRDILRWKALVL